MYSITDKNMYICIIKAFVTDPDFQDVVNSVNSGLW